MTSNILMIQPVAFGFNEDTAKDNFFQKKGMTPAQEIQNKALKEYDTMVQTLRILGVNVISVADTLSPHTPDSIFPNNWVSFHESGNVALYPMFAENRRLERRVEILEVLKREGLIINDIIDYTDAEKSNMPSFLEGTGSMVLDRENKIAYAAISKRTDKALLEKFCNDFGYNPCSFTAYQTVGDERKPIYHTNVMMCVGDKFTVVCLECIDNKEEREKLKKTISESGKEIIELTEQQIHNFAGNMLQIKGANDEPLLILSGSACKSLFQEQINRLSSYNRLIPVNIPTIEFYGGGSVRCMMAEIYNPFNS